MTGAGNSGLECESLEKKWWGVGCGSVGLHMKRMLPGKVFAVFRNHLSLGSTIPFGATRPQDVKASKTQNKKI